MGTHREVIAHEVSAAAPLLSKKIREEENETALEILESLLGKVVRLRRQETSATATPHMAA